MIRQFTPSEDNSRDFRDALGCFATGITVITAPTAGVGIGMTANSFSALSLAPPLVLWAPAKSSERYTFFCESSHFAIHVLRNDQMSLARDFADHGDAFDKIDVRHNNAGVPIFDNCLARFECQTHAIHEGGDHSIMVGLVTQAMIGEGTPLIFAQRQYGGFDPRT
ncbi:flavin reductase family protein [Shimia thalassica]|uniref:flavin reductase family protein n=1 Tax=Shimia thalassica TaxID=1715693 RepID=UPI001C0942CA|nr:flavin reductase family protein [Shimia thalassica]MBU2942291.1 flavin reductase family protein [Shimia thalassica]MDO6505124.1 flavin reductase family protein [Shimia thalassica]